MKSCLAKAATLLTLALPVNADELTDAATAFVDSPVQTQLIDDMMSADAMMVQFQAMNLKIPDDKLPQIIKILEEEIGAIRPQMRQAMIEGTAHTFTLDEINALSDFYSSPLGASAMSKMTPYMQKTMSTMAPALQSMQANIMRRVNTELK